LGFFFGYSEVNSESVV